jgi:eukaryotic-like serine/threonine-protein kinase
MKEASIVDRTGSDAKAIFIAALDRESGAERAEYVNAACGDRVALKRRVESLLAAHERADQVLGPDRTPTIAATVAASDVSADQHKVEPAEALGPQASSRDATVSLSARSDARGETATHPDRRNGDALSYGTPVRYFGDYEVLGELGRGGMGVVYKARQVTLNRTVALKMIRTGLLASHDDVRRFQNEAEAVALLDHPGIVPVYEVGDHQGQRYFSMKLIDGTSLVSTLANYKDHPKAAARLVALATEAVAHAHMRGILHRDLKPANILVDPDGHPHVTDFGLAKRLVEDVELTQSGAILGTPAYMSPEQAAGRRGTITMATDVYGLGAVLYALLAGKAPFGGASIADTLQAVKEHPPEPPTKWNARVPRDLETICLKCLDKDPRRRYPTAQALADDLHAWLERRPIAARRVGPAERAWLWCKRRPALAGLIAALALSLISATGLSIAYARQQASRARTEQLLRKEAIKMRDLSARQTYISLVKLAWFEWQEAHPARVRDLLAATRPDHESAPDFRGFEWFYLDRLNRAPLWTFTPTESFGSSIAFDPKGAWIAVALDGRAGTTSDVVVLDAGTGTEIRRIPSRRARFGTIAVSPDGNQLVLPAHDGTTVFLDVATGEERQRLKSGTIKTVPAGVLSFSGDGRQFARLVASSASDPAQFVVEIWDVAARTKQQSFSIPRGANARLSLNPDGSRVATASVGLRTWNASTGKLEREIDADELFTDVAYSPDGRLLAGATFAGWTGLWDSASGARRETLSGHRGEVHRIRFSPDGKRLVSAGRDRIIRIWDVPAGDLHLELRGHQSEIWDVGFTADGHHLASVGFHNGEVKFWHAEQAPESIELRNEQLSAGDPMTHVLAFSPDGRVLAAAQSGGDLEAWDLVQGRSLFRIDQHAGSGRGWLAIGPKSDVLATLGEKRSIVLRNPSTGALIRTLDSSEGSRSGAFSPDGRFLVAGGDRAGSIRVWEISNGRLVAILNGHTESVECLAFSPDGQKLASGSFDTTVRVWDFASGKESMVYRGHKSFLAALAFHPDGRTLASSSSDSRMYGEIRLWDSATAKESQILRGDSAFVRRLSFLPDGRRLVSLGDDGVLKLWDLVSGQETLSIAAHSRNGLGLAVSPDGRRLATSGAEGSIRVWDSGAQRER